MALRRALGAGGAWLLLLAACDRAAESTAVPVLLREGRFGSLRDLVLLERSVTGPSTSALFLDRFEVTRGDWAGFAESGAGVAVGATAPSAAGDPSLPVGGIDLEQARAFAGWRFGRLPQAAEWAMAATAEGRHRFPWGSRIEAPRANTAELGIGEPLPVGTFESGRRGEGSPYDLVGNVSEWTETVPASWYSDDGEAVPTAVGAGRGEVPSVMRRRLLACGAFAVWQGVGGLVPPGALVGAGGVAVPRAVVGADFQGSMASLEDQVLAGDRRARTGARIAASPDQLLVALAAYAPEPTPAEWEQVRRFFARGRHRQVLTEAWPLAVAAGVSRSTPLGRWLAAQCEGGAEPAGR